MLKKIEDMGVDIAYVTLHVGLGTFRPVKVDDVTDHHMHSECIRHVNAHAQAAYIHLLMPELTPSEAELVRRGRNTHIHHPVPKNQNPEDYSFATGLRFCLAFFF